MSRTKRHIDIELGLILVHRRRYYHELVVALFARLALLVVWLTTPLVQRAFQGGWILPLLGILLLPITTLTYVLVYYIAGSVTGWGWLWSPWQCFSTWQRIVTLPGAPHEPEAVALAAPPNRGASSLVTGERGIRR